MNQLTASLNWGCTWAVIVLKVSIATIEGSYAWEMEMEISLKWYNNPIVCGLFLSIQLGQRNGEMHNIRSITLIIRRERPKVAEKRQQNKKIMNNHADKIHERRMN